MRGAIKKVLNVDRNQRWPTLGVADDAGVRPRAEKRPADLASVNAAYVMRSATGQISERRDDEGTDPSFPVCKCRASH